MTKEVNDCIVESAQKKLLQHDQQLVAGCDDADMPIYARCETQRTQAGNTQQHTGGQQGPCEQMRPKASYKPAGVVAKVAITVSFQNLAFGRLVPFLRLIVHEEIC